MSRDDEVLHSLDHYETALRRVSADFASRGAAVEPIGVQLGEMNGIFVSYRVTSGGGPRPYDQPPVPGDRRDRLPGVGALPMVTTVEEAVVALADILQEKALEEGDTAWPGCRPGHPHPPTPRLSAGTAVWSCPRDTTTLSGIG
ncbi:hypothetical protein AB0K04_08740 [Micromonospora coxensis]|uniref:hypothetical protein n=1 Tax=Micromonospora coxensis TaxID=356852 RepID=UPI00342369CB